MARRKSMQSDRSSSHYSSTSSRNSAIKLRSGSNRNVLFRSQKQVELQQAREAHAAALAKLRAINEQPLPREGLSEEARLAAEAIKAAAIDEVARTEEGASNTLCFVSSCAATLGDAVVSDHLDLSCYLLVSDEEEQSYELHSFVDYNHPTVALGEGNIDLVEAFDFKKSEGKQSLKVNLDHIDAALDDIDCIYITLSARSVDDRDVPKLGSLQWPSFSLLTGGNSILSIDSMYADAAIARGMLVCCIIKDADGTWQVFELSEPVDASAQEPDLLLGAICEHAELEFEVAKEQQDMKSAMMANLW